MSVAQLGVTLEQPVLRLALLGFPLEQAARLAQWATRSEPGWPVWRIASPDKADAWCVHGGAIASADAQGHLVINTLWPRQPQVALDPMQTERPIALAEPLPPGIEATERVSVDSENEVRLTLQRFEAWLRPLRSQFALGAAVLANQRSLSTHVYHLHVKNRLMAVVDLVNLRIGLDPKARPVDLEAATWDKRPPSAADVPTGFMKLSLAQLMWNYAMRTERDVLPARYRTHKIHQRRSIGVPVQWLQDEHLLLMSELKVASAALDELVMRTGLLPSELSRYLAALYFAGMVSTRQHGGARAGRAVSDSLPSRPPSSRPASQFQHSDLASLQPTGFGVSNLQQPGPDAQDTTAFLGLVDDEPRR